MVAPMVLDGLISDAAFQGYIEQVLVPELRPGDIVITSRCVRPCEQGESQVWCGASSGADMCTASSAAA